MKISSDFLMQLQSFRRNVHALISLLFLLFAFIFGFLGVSSIISVIVQPIVVLIIPGYLFAEIFFKQDDIVDKLLIGYGISTFNSTVIFYILLLLYNKPITPLVSPLFLFVLFIESLVLILIDYFGSKNRVSRNSEFKVRFDYLLAKKNHLLLGLLLCTLLLGQILLVKIHLYWPDEHTYVYTSRNLLQANYSHLPMPPVMDPRLWTPRYVFIGMNTIFYLFFGLNLTAPQAFVVISSLMLILATYALANILYGKKAGLIAGIYVTFNPTFWWIARRVVPDVVVTALLWSGIYFLIKVCKHNEQEIRWQYIPISGLFLGLAVLVKLTVIFAVPTFFAILIAFQRRISKKRTSLFYMICLVGTISLLVVFLASERYTEYLFFLLSNFSYFLQRWDWKVAYTTMIEPFLIISPVFIFCILGIIFDFKRRERGRDAIILFITWVSYFFLPLILPEQAIDPRQVFPAHVGPSIIAAFGTVEVTKRGKLWERMLYLMVFAQVFFETMIRVYVRISQVPRVLIELVLVILLIVVLRKVIQKVKLHPSQALKTRAVVLLGLILVIFVNGHALSSLGWSDRTRSIRLEILSATQTSLELSGRWLIANTSESSVLMTNEFKRLPYYAEFRITYPLPDYEFSFFQSVDNNNIEYLILFLSIWSDRNPYMLKYFKIAPSNMIEMTRWDYTVEDGREMGFIIYKVIEGSR